MKTPRAKQNRRAAKASKSPPVERTPRAKSKARAAKKAADVRAPRAKAKASIPAESSGARTDPDVVAFLEELDHPLKKALEDVRKIVLGASPAIREGIKWKSPSFRTTDWFATLNLRAKDGAERVWLILHTGAKVKASAETGLDLADPAGLLTWLAKDRAVVTFADAKDVRAKKAALHALVAEWIRFV